MTTTQLSIANTGSSELPASGRMLSDAELLAVSGGGDTYGNALTIAAGFVGAAAATVAMPVVAGAFALGSIGASAVAIYSALNDDERNSKQ
ncbi:MAG: hypothetical protein AB8B93_18375 [Pseudomonadales bacterium]